MSESIWVPALVAAIVSPLVVWGREWLRSYLRRPRLKVVACEYHDDSKNRYFYVTVKNEGKTTARACVGQLTVEPLNLA